MITATNLTLCASLQARAAIVVSTFVKLEPLRKVDLMDGIFAPVLVPVFPEYIPGIKQVLPWVPFISTVITRKRVIACTSSYAARSLRLRATAVAKGQHN